MKENKKKAKLKDHICNWAEAWFVDYIENFYESIKIKMEKNEQTFLQES